MEALERFDVDFDFPAKRLRLWNPGTARRAALEAGSATVEAAVVNETRLLGFRAVASAAAGGGAEARPFLGVVDCGASFSVVNWEAASSLGLPPWGDVGAYEKNPAVVGMGVDGRPQMLPTHRVGLSFCGGPVVAKGGTEGPTVTFEPPPRRWKPWDPVDVAVGDLPVFSQLLGDGRTPYRGPAGIIGLDVLSQRRVILEAGTGRRRRIYVGNRP